MPLMLQLTGVVVEAPVVDDAGEAGAGPGGGLVHALPQRLQPAQEIVCYIWRRNARVIVCYIWRRNARTVIIS